MLEESEGFVEGLEIDGLLRNRYGLPVEGYKVAIDEDTDVAGDTAPISCCKGFQALAKGSIDNDT